MVADRLSVGEDGYVTVMDPMKTDDSLQLFKEETLDGVAVYSIYLKKVRYHTTLDDAVVDVTGGAGTVDDRAAHLQWRLEEVRVIRAGTLPRLVAAIASEESGELDSTYVNVLLATYRTFTNQSKLFAEIKARYCDVGEDRSLPQFAREGCQKSLRTVLCVWMDTYPEDFREPLDYPTLNAVLQFSQTVAVDNDLTQKTRDLLSSFKKQEDSDQSESGLIDDLVKSVRLTTLTSTQSTSPRCLRAPVDMLSIPAKVFAEQLTFVDAELFKQVIPHHCLGAVWSRRADKKCAVLPVSVYATVDQFNAVSYRVIATILKYPYAAPFERAVVIEKWIDVAQECRVLKNFSSLKAVIAGLQSHAVFRLKKTWEQVAREKMGLFAELADIFNENDNQCLWRELLNREGTAKFADPESVNTIKKRERSSGTLSRNVRRLVNFETPSSSTMQGTVPYLGTFLTDLTMVDTALKDVSKEGLINFEKRRKEYELMTQIQMLQSTASMYRIEPEPEFYNWFYNIRVYDESESHELSHDIEPSENFPTIDRRTHRKNASLGFFSPRHREGLENVQFSRSRQNSLTSLHTKQDDDDSHSVASMHELYLSAPHPQVRHSISMSSMKSFSPNDVLPSLTSPYQTSEMIAVKVYLQIPENHLTNHYKSILLSNNDHARVVLRNTLVKYDVAGKPEDFTIVQLLPDKTELPLPERGNIFYAIRKDVPEIRFIVRRNSDSSRQKRKNGLLAKHRSSSLLRVIF